MEARENSTKNKKSMRKFRLIRVVRSLITVGVLISVLIILSKPSHRYTDATIIYLIFPVLIGFTMEVVAISTVFLRRFRWSLFLGLLSTLILSYLAVLSLVNCVGYAPGGPIVSQVMFNISFVSIVGLLTHAVFSVFEELIHYR